MHQIAKMIARSTWVAALLAIAHPVAAQPAAERLTLTPGFSPDPVTRAGRAGGTTDAQTLGTGPMGACVGWVAPSPNYQMTLTAPFDYLELAVTSSGDTTLVIQGPVGYWCNDDSNGLNPALFGRWAEGDYRIWVGTFSPGPMPEFTMTLSGDPNGAPDRAPPPTPGVVTPPPLGIGQPGVMTTPPGPTSAPPGLRTSSSTPTNGALTLHPGFAPTPQSLGGFAGAGLSAQGLGATPTGLCQGWVNAEPQHLLTLTSPFSYLRLDVTSPGDTTLVVLGPSGWWCNDDTLGLNPRVAGSWSAGQYRIWVGSYGVGQAQPYTLQVSESQ